MFACLAALAASTPALPAPPEAHPLLATRILDQRVATIGHRLAVTATDFCAERQWLPGFAIHDLSQYGTESRAAAAGIFPLEDGPGILAVAANSPAERAGLAIDDVLLEVDGRPLPPGTAARHGTYDHVEAISEILERAFSDGSGELDLRRGGEALKVRIQAEQGCGSRFQLLPSDKLNARADGLYVQVTSAIANYVRDDDELAAVLAHEFAHNILRHRRRLDEAEISRGFLSNFGRNARLFRETESEADRLSIHLLDRGGYDPEAAVRFWTRFGPRGLGLFDSPTHPNWRRRVAAFREEIDGIARAKAAGERPMPEFLRSSATEATR